MALKAVFAFSLHSSSEGGGNAPISWFATARKTQEEAAAISVSEYKHKADVEKITFKQVEEWRRNVTVGVGTKVILETDKETERTAAYQDI